MLNATPVVNTFYDWEQSLQLYFGALKDSPLLDEIEADYRRIRELANPRTCSFGLES